MREEPLRDDLGDGHRSGNGPVDLGLSGPSSPAEQRSAAVVGDVTGGGSYRVLVVVGAIVVALVGLLALLNRTTSDGAPGQEAAVDGAEGTPLPTLPGFFTTPSGPLPTPTPGRAVSPEDGPTTSVATTMVPGQYFLGEPTGLWLFYGGADPLQRLDLDTAAVDRYGIEAFPIVATGGDLVIHKRVSGVTGWVSVDDPGEQPLNWKRGPVATDAEPGRLWILDPTAEPADPAGDAAGLGRWELFDMEDNRVLERRPGELYAELEDDVTFPGSTRVEIETRRPGPDLSTRPDGVYAYGDGGYRRLTEGRLLAYDAGRVLVGDCSAAADCRNRWLDQVGGAELDLPAPSGDVVFAELLAEGRWLHSISGDAGSSLLELETGRRLDFEVDAFPTVSPDGRWIAVLTDRLTVIDSFSGREVAEFDGFLRRGGGRVVFASR